MLAKKDWNDQSDPLKPFPETYIFSDSKDRLLVPQRISCE